jgi:hypothetical protein
MRNIDRIIESNQFLKTYLPDNYKINRLSRDFIFTLIYTITPDVYKNMKSSVEIQNDSNRMKRLENSYIKVDQDVLESVLEKKELKVYAIFI